MFMLCSGTQLPFHPGFLAFLFQLIPTIVWIIVLSTMNIREEKVPGSLLVWCGIFELYLHHFRFVFGPSTVVGKTKTASWPWRRAIASVGADFPRRGIIGMEFHFSFGKGRWSFLSVRERTRQRARLSPNEVLHYRKRKRYYHHHTVGK